LSRPGVVRPLLFSAADITRPGSNPGRASQEKALLRHYCV
jgi:hypothetical protein